MNFSTSVQQTTTPMLGSDPSAASASSPMQQQGGHHPQHLVRYRHSKRKIKCSGTRPICDHCLRRGIPCIYKPLARARRTPTISGSPAQHLAISGSFDQMFSGLTPPSPFASSSGAQPIPIPMSMQAGQLAETTGMAYSQLSPYSICQRPDSRYASAPHPATAPFVQNMHGSPLPGAMAASGGRESGGSLGQNKHMRPANAIPPHLLETANMSSAMSPINSPQTPYSLTGIPPDFAGLSGSFNSIQSDLSEMMSPLSSSTRQTTQKSDGTVDMQTLYDIQIPPQSAGHGGASLSSLSMQSPGVSLGDCVRGSYLNEDGTLSMLPSTSQPAQSAFTGGAGNRKRQGHKRTLTQDSTDSLSNVPLLERTSLEAAGSFGSGATGNSGAAGTEFDQLLFSLSQGSMEGLPFSSSLSPEASQQQQMQQQQQQMQMQQMQMSPGTASANNSNNASGFNGIAPELTVYSEQAGGDSNGSAQTQRSVPQPPQMFQF